MPQKKTQKPATATVRILASDHLYLKIAGATEGKQMQELVAEMIATRKAAAEEDKG